MEGGLETLRDSLTSAVTILWSDPTDEKLEYASVLVFPFVAHQYVVKERANTFWVFKSPLLSIPLLKHCVRCQQRFLACELNQSFAILVDLFVQCMLCVC